MQWITQILHNTVERLYDGDLMLAVGDGPLAFATPKQPQVWKLGLKSYK